MASKKSNDAFTSFRILGKKAQALLLKATQELKKKEQSSAPGAWADPPKEESLQVKFSMKNVALATLTVIAIVCGILLIVVLQDKIILLLLGFFVAAVIDPGVRTMEKWGIPRGLGILAHYLLALFVVVFLLISLIPIVATQLQQIASLISTAVDEFLQHPSVWLPLVGDDVNQQLTRLFEGMLQNHSIKSFTDALNQLSLGMTSVTEGAVFAGKLGLSVVGFFAQLIVVLVLAFFIQIEREQLRMWIRSFFATRQKAYIDSKVEAMHQKIGQWARGQLLLGLAIGLLVYIALKILNIPNAETLAVLAGFTEFIPYIGPFIAAIPAILIALPSGGPWWALIVAGIYYVIQWCENNLLVPLIMKRAVGLSPIAILFAIMVGLSFSNVMNPVLGVLLAVPATTIVTIFLNDLRRTPGNS